jgi:hypothetical protein
MSALPTTKQKPRIYAWQFLHSPQENIWVWLRQSLEKIAHSGDNFQFCSEMVAFYAKARTYFERKG